MARLAVIGAILVGGLLAGVGHSEPERLDASIAAYKQRVRADFANQPDTRGATPAQVERRLEGLHAPEQLIQPARDQDDLKPRLALLAAAVSSDDLSVTDLLAAIPDPDEVDRVFTQRLDGLRELTSETRVIESYRKVVAKAREFLDAVRRPQRVRLSLAECIQRALMHNYTIRVQAYNPAIQAETLVEAAAAFDAEFFLDTSASHQDRDAMVPSGTEQNDTTAVSGGLRKLLPTGMTAQVGLSWSRTYIDSVDLPKRTNPAHRANFTAELRQPLLRNFGLQVNRAQIEIARVSRDSSYWVFRRNVRDQVQAVETAYWNLVSARRNVAILAESVAQNWVTKEDMWERREHDATPVEIANSRARYQIRYVEYLESIRLLKDAEDALKNLINDPALTLARDIEIIPTEQPLAAGLTIDQFAEVRAALDHRAEITEARLGIETLRIQTAVAKNQVLPQLDLTFTYDVDGVSWSGDNAWDRVVQNDYISYSVAAQFSYPIGNRARQAALRRRRLQEMQATVQLEQVIDSIVQEVNSAVRSIFVRYAQLPEQLGAVKSSERNLRSLQARATAISPTFLETELSAVEQLASARTRLLQVLISYNTGIVDLERAKGTLLEYNNIRLSEPPPGR